MKLTTRNSAQAGFALIATISILVLLVLLSVGFLSLSALTIKSSRSSSSINLARANARMALLIAIGDLQKYAGPDQRVTATSDLLNATATAGTEKWTGVWDASRVEGQQEYGSENRLKGWLVSQPNATPFAGSDPAGLLSGTDIELVSRIGNGSELLRSEVKVPLVRIQGGNRALGDGSYGYWVSDENLKAHLCAPESPSNDLEAEARLGTSQNAIPNVVGLLRNSNKFENADWSKEETKGILRKVSTTDTFHLAMKEIAGNSSPIEFDDLLHDLSVFSKSLFTNVALGGMKYDLSLALKLGRSNFEGEFVSVMEDQFEGRWGNRFSDHRTQMFPPVLEGSSIDVGGPEWIQLYNYANRKVGPSKELSFSRPTNSDPGFFPVMTRSQFQTKAFVEIEKISGREIPTAVHGMIFPAMTFWNPYNVTMNVSSPLYVEMALNGIIFYSDATGSSPIDWFFLFGNKEGTHESNYEGPGTCRFMRFVIPPFRLEPGQAMNFAPSSNAPIDFGHNNELTPQDPGLRPTYFYTKKTVGQSTRNQFLRARNSFPRFGNHGDVFRKIDYGLTYIYAADDFSTNSRIAAYSAGTEVSGLRKGSQQALPYIEIADAPRPIGNGVQPVHIENFDFRNPTFDPSVGLTAIMAFPGVESGSFSPLPLYQQCNVRAVISQYPPQEQRLEADRAFNEDGKPGGGGVPGWSNFMYRDPRTTGGESASDVEAYFTAGLTSDKGYTGNHFSPSGDGSSTSVLFDVPNSQQPFFSVGELMHASFFKLPLNIEDLRLKSESTANHNYYLQGNSPTYAIGNSFADFVIPLSKTGVNYSQSESNVRGVDQIRGAHYDYSYLLNEAFWDTFSFSTLAPKTTLEEVEEGLPNGRINAVPDALAEDLDNWQTSLASLYTRGGFNINSTSVVAWAAILSSFRDLDLPSESGDLEGYNRDGNHTFARNLEPMGSALQPGLSDPEKEYTTYRRLSDEQILDLATEIVEQNKLRAENRSIPRPFLSLAEFINRSIDPDQIQLAPEFSYSGVVQSAIDSTNINEHHSSGTGDFVQGFSSENYDDENIRMIERQPIRSCSPGSLMQADILSRIGSILTPRSDTFTIRSYGNALDSGGRILAEAYCEAVVQRTPDYVGGENRTSRPDQLGDNSQAFGRKFKMVSFRWLNKEEI